MIGIIILIDKYNIVMLGCDTREITNLIVAIKIKGEVMNVNTLVNEAILSNILIPGK
jgi:hypothetical protein